jgi:hypothetical protein
VFKGSRTDTNTDGGETDVHKLHIRYNSGRMPNKIFKPCVFFIVLIFGLHIALKQGHGNCPAWEPTEGQHWTATCDLKA